MNTSYQSKLLALYLGIWIALMPMLATAEDIDIFTGGSAGSAANPNILIVIDNTANWSRQSQQWPDGANQGQSEANAVKTVINALGSNGTGVNIGLMEFATNGNSNIDGGFIRSAIRPMTSTNVSNFSTKLDTIYNNITSPDEKHNTGTPYGDLMYDVYNYYAGAGVSNDGSNNCALLNPPNNDTDAGGYITNYSQFKSPVSAADSCARNFVIFIGNPGSSGPTPDTIANSCELYKLSNGTTTCPAGNFSPQLGLPNFSSVGANVYTTIGQTAQCYTSAQVSSFNTAIDTCVAGNAASCYSSQVSTNYVTSTSTTNSSVTGCSIYTQDCNLGAAATSNYPMACAAGTQSYNVVQTGVVVTGPTAGTWSTNSANSTVCYPTSGQASAAISATSSPDTAGMTCPIPALPVGATSTMTSQSTFVATRNYYTTSGSSKFETVATNNCTYAAGTSSSCTLSNIVTTYPTTACYSTVSAPASASITISSPTTTTAFSSCPAGFNCSYTNTGAATVCTGTPAAKTGVTAYFASAPVPTTPSSSSSVATTPTLTCDSGYNCTYSAAVNATAAGGTQTYNTTGYYPSAPAITSPASSSSLATTTTLTCPVNNTCTYSVGTANAPVASVGSNYTASNKESSCTPTAAVLTGTYTYTNNTAGPINNPSPFTDTAGVSHTWTSGTQCGAHNICVISNIDNTSSTCTGGKKWALRQTATGMSTYPVTQTGTPMSNYTITQTPIANYTYNLTQTATAISGGPGLYTVNQTVKPSTTVTTTGTTNLGSSSQCFNSAPTYAWSGSSDYSSLCTGSGVTCAFGTTTATTTNYCGVGSNQYTVQGNNLVLQQAPNGTFTTDTAVYNADEWAKLMFQKGVPVTGGSNATVNTYTIDVYNKQPNNAETGLYMSMAKNGGGKYYAATNESAIAAALDKILAEIQSVNSTFASASLPVNSTNRAQNANQVFIGMFRPDPNAGPRWFGNLKQYQIGSNGITLDLYDNSTPSKPAINLQTGFMDDCAQSFWTTDSSTPYSATYPWANNVYNTDAYYWNNIILLTTSPASKCVTASTYSNSLYSDIADGAFVEKGAVAEVLRKGNNPAAATPTWSFNRNMYTLNIAGALVVYGSNTLGVLTEGLSTDAFHFTQGKDVDGDCSATPAPCSHSSLSNWTSSTNIMRPSVHGDVVHSRPLPINYGTSTNANAGVTAYYGANDGTFRAVVASGSNAGKELWAFTAPEFSSALASRSPASSSDPLTRLMNNSPLVNYPTVSATLSPTPIPKDYFFDGSTGVYQDINNTKVWIYPSMRRGGRMIYSFDVTNSNPSLSAAQPVAFKWRAGCPDLTDDIGCTATGIASPATMSDIGQTWSTPAPVPIKGYSTTKPAVVVGGGYDSCEDADTSAPSCGGGKGHVVYVLDANTGALIKSFTTLSSVIADVAFVDVDNDSYVDYGYVLDTGGNVYRINFSDPASNNAPLSSTNWTMQRIAYTSGGGRKFQWAPGLLPSGGKVYMAFASGDREHPLIINYPYTTPVTNRLYVYLDDMVSTDTNLDGATVSNFTAPTTCNTAGIGSSGNTNTGWYMDFPGRGEQAVTSAVIAGGMVTVSTNRPIPPVSGTCSTALGEARGYWVNLFNASGAMNVTGSCGGDRSGNFVGGGLPPSPVIGTVPIDGVPTTVLIGAIQRGGGASSPIAPQKMRPTIPSTRKTHYWKNSGDN